MAFFSLCHLVSLSLSHTFTHSPDWCSIACAISSLLDSFKVPIQHRVTFPNIVGCDLLHNFSPFTAHFCQMKKLFIKYAGCLYSIKDWSKCQNRLPTEISACIRFESLSARYTLQQQQTTKRAQMSVYYVSSTKSTCTYWLGTHTHIHSTYYQWWFCKFFAYLRVVRFHRRFGQIWPQRNWLLCVHAFHRHHHNITPQIPSHRRLPLFVHYFSFGLYVRFVLFTLFSPICFQIINPTINYYRWKYRIFGEVTFWYLKIFNGKYGIVFGAGEKFQF